MNTGGRLEAFLAGVLLALLLMISLYHCACATSPPASPMLSQVSGGLHRLACVCGGVAFLRVETEPRLRVTVTSRGAPLGIVLDPLEGDLYGLRCSCGWAYLVRVVVDGEGAVTIVLEHSEPPPTPPAPPLITA